MKETFIEFKTRCIGITKKEIAMQLDKSDPLFNYSAESGLTSYHNYKRDELLLTCYIYDIDPESNYMKSRKAK